MKNCRVTQAKALFEADVSVNGYSYLVIYGKHINGYYCCIPNWQVGCEMAEPSDTFYNTERLQGAGIHGDTARELAKAIREIYNALGEK